MLNMFNKVFTVLHLKQISAATSFCFVLFFNIQYETNILKM